MWAAARTMPVAIILGQLDVRWLDLPTICLLLAVLGILAVAFAVGQVLKRQPETTVNPAIVQAFNQRVKVWWMICAILALGVILGRVATVVLFCLVSMWALREYITMTPTRRGDHRVLFWTLLLFTPLQYVFVGIGRSLIDSETWLANVLPRIDFYGVYTIMIPVYASLFIPARIALSGDHKRFLERTAKIQAGLLICVYALSHAPALLDLKLSYRVAGEQGPEWRDWSGAEGSNAGLLFFFILIVQLGDALQFAWDRLAGKHVIAPAINASRTWEGFIGGVLSTIVMGVLFSWVTPFTLVGAAIMSMIVAVMGFAGGMTMSAIKRDRGVEDYGTLVQGHPGLLDRVDSICFAAPVFFHLTRYFFFVIPGLN
jgi:phosphatidate cytidylyltransferase